MLRCPKCGWCVENMFSPVMIEDNGEDIILRRYSGICKHCGADIRLIKQFVMEDQWVERIV